MGLARGSSGTEAAAKTPVRSAPSHQLLLPTSLAQHLVHGGLVHVVCTCLLACARSLGAGLARRHGAPVGLLWLLLLLLRRALLRASSRGKLLLRPPDLPMPAFLLPVYSSPQARECGVTSIWTSPGTSPGRVLLDQGAGAR
jgi:hypothetical protein